MCLGGGRLQPVNSADRPGAQCWSVSGRGFGLSRCHACTSWTAGHIAPALTFAINWAVCDRCRCIKAVHSSRMARAVARKDGPFGQGVAGCPPAVVLRVQPQRKQCILQQEDQRASRLAVRAARAPPMAPSDGNWSAEEELVLPARGQEQPQAQLRVRHHCRKKPLPPLPAPTLAASLATAVQQLPSPLSLVLVTGGGSCTTPLAAASTKAEAWRAEGAEPVGDMPEGRLDASAAACVHELPAGCTYSITLQLLAACNVLGEDHCTLYHCTSTGCWLPAAACSHLPAYCCPPGADTSRWWLESMPCALPWLPCLTNSWQPRQGS